MGIFSTVRRQATSWVRRNPDKVERYGRQAVTKGGDALNRATGGKYSDKVRKAQDAAGQRLDDTQGEPPAPGTPGPQEEPPPGGTR